MSSLSTKLGPLRALDELESQHHQHQQTEDILRTSQPRHNGSIIPDDVIILVLEFLDPRSLCIAQLLETRVRKLAIYHSKYLWDRHFAVAAFTIGPNVSSDETRMVYLEARLARMERDIAHYHNSHHVRSAMYAFAHASELPFSCGVIGMVGDLCMVDDERIASAISRKRNAAMTTVIVRDVGTIERFRKSGPSHTRGPSSYMPLTTTLKMQDEPFPAVNAPGFLGYAMHLIKLRPQHEYLRDAMYTLFRNLMVFDTMENSIAFREELTRNNPNGARKQWLVALDQFGDVVEPGENIHRCVGVGRFRSEYHREEPAAQIERLTREANSMRHSIAYMRYGM